MNNQNLNLLFKYKLIKYCIYGWTKLVRKLLKGSYLVSLSVVSRKLSNTPNLKIILSKIPNVSGESWGNVLIFNGLFYYWFHEMKVCINFYLAYFYKHYILFYWLKETFGHIYNDMKWMIISKYGIRKQWYFWLWGAQNEFLYRGLTFFIWNHWQYIMVSSEVC